MRGEWHLRRKIAGSHSFGNMRRVSEGNFLSAPFPRGLQTGFLNDARKLGREVLESREPAGELLEHLESKARTRCYPSVNEVSMALLALPKSAR